MLSNALIFYLHGKFEVVQEEIKFELGWPVVVNEWILLLSSSLLFL